MTASLITKNITNIKKNYVQSEVNKMHRIVHVMKLTEKKLTELNGNRTLERFLKRGERLRQKLLDVILKEEDKKPEAKNKTNTISKSKSIIYNRINKSGSTSLLGSPFNCYWLQIISHYFFSVTYHFYI